MRLVKLKNIRGSTVFQMLVCLNEKITIPHFLLPNIDFRETGGTWETETSGEAGGTGETEGSGEAGWSEETGGSGETGGIGETGGTGETGGKQREKYNM